MTNNSNDDFRNTQQPQRVEGGPPPGFPSSVQPNVTESGASRAFPQENKENWGTLSTNQGDFENKFNNFYQSPQQETQASPRSFSPPQNSHMQQSISGGMSADAYHMQDLDKLEKVSLKEKALLKFANFKKDKSENEKTGGAAHGISSGGPLALMKNLSIRNKMFFVALPPLIVVFLLSVIGVVDRREEASELSRAVDLVEFIDSNSYLANSLRREGIYSSAYMASGGNEVFTSELDVARRSTNAALENFEASLVATNPTENNPEAERRLEEFNTRVSNLATARQGVDQFQLPINKANNQYFNLVSASDQLTRAVAQTVSSPELTRGLLSIVNLAPLQTALAAEASIVAAAEIRGGFFTASDEICESALAPNCQSFIEAQEFRARLVASEKIFEELAPQDLRQEKRDSSSTEEYDERVRNIYNSARNANTLAVSGASSAENEVVSSASSQLDVLNEIQKATIATTKGDAEQIASDARRAVWLFALAALLALVFAAAVAAYAARATIEPLRRLTIAATRLADTKIPELVQKLRDPQMSSESVDEFAQNEIQGEFEAIAVDSSDEIGQLADAFRSIQEVTVDVAEQQNELLRKGIGDIFVNLARRNQVLLDRQIQFIEKMESGEENPDQLSDLFKLEHLATRMRRNAESLLVLAGAEQNRGKRSKPISLSDVIRVGMGEVEDFQRVRIVSLEQVSVPGNVASDLAHMLGEIIENSTQFSPPDSFVDVKGGFETSGDYRISIVDKGIGMTDEAIASANELLANPPLMGLEISRSLGFIVVGRLAVRFGIKVFLSSNPEGGVIASVVIPADALFIPGVPRISPPAVGNTTLNDSNASGAQISSVGGQPAGSTSPSAPVQRPIQQSRSTISPPPFPGVTPPATPAPESSEVSGQKLTGRQMPSRSSQAANLKFASPPDNPTSFHPGPSLPPPPETAKPVIPTGTGGDLPRRQPKNNMTPPASAVPVENSGRAERSPEQVRSMLNSYQAGLKRGKTEGGSFSVLGNEQPPSNKVVSPPPQGPPQGPPAIPSSVPPQGPPVTSAQSQREDFGKTEDGLPRRRASVPSNYPPPQGAPVRAMSKPAAAGQSVRTPEEVREMLLKYRSGLNRGRPANS